MNKAYLLIGGNLGNRKKQLQKATEKIGQTCGTITRLSHFYETAAWGKTDQPPFLNQALALDTSLLPRHLLDAILDIETGMGRRRVEKFGPRIIDIDILLWNDEVFDQPNLKIPHPELINRRFALEPLSEIAPGMIHPVFKKTILCLLQECTDALEVRKLEN
jgi:2-amino-4-hydroxy-6-hydroxymethyldihydropteridine diphosphokinase